MWILLSFATCAILGLGFSVATERRNTAGMTVARALTLMRDSKDADLRAAARFVLDAAFHEAIELLLMDPETGQAGLLLAHWKRLIER